MAGDQSMRIAELLESRIAVIGSSLGLPIAWPNIAFTPLIMRHTGAFISCPPKRWDRIWRVRCVPIMASCN